MVTVILSNKIPENWILEMQATNETHDWPKLSCGFSNYAKLEFGVTFWNRFAVSGAKVKWALKIMASDTGETASHWSSNKINVDLVIVYFREVNVI